ncbi:MAG: two-component system chemotaxis response regulator CheY [Candidatus Paceibacteria bacterium]|jgi:two-component system chemotaxis response regulator CheY
MSIDRRILIADDDREIRLGLADLLEPLGLDIVLAENGSTALQMVRSGNLNLALLDYNMPGASGLDILEAIQSEFLGIPAILCSADAGGELGQLALRAGAYAVLTKPIMPAQLKQHVVSALELPPSMGLTGLA